MAIELRISETELGGELTLLPGSSQVRIEARLSNRALEVYGLTVESFRYRWHADNGTLFYVSPTSQSPVNSWLPPDDSRVSTVRVTYEARLRSLRDPTLVHEAACSASRSFLSITHPKHFRDGYIGDFKIGLYPDPANAQAVFQEFGATESKWPSLYPWRYAPPPGFYKVTEDNIDMRVSENFKLRFFSMDYPWRSEGFPQYVAIDLRLLRKLEDLLALMREAGHNISTFTPIYGFRKPAYNLEAIRDGGDENLKAPFSMHQYGRAVDLIVDEDGDMIMDDLNGDGRHDIHDAAEFMKYVNLLDRRYREKGSDLVGGAGMYARHDFFDRPIQTPYVHIDVRGYLGDEGRLVRWADPPTWPDGRSIIWAQLYPDAVRLTAPQARLGGP